MSIAKTVIGITAITAVVGICVVACVSYVKQCKKYRAAVDELDTACNELVTATAAAPIKYNVISNSTASLVKAARSNADIWSVSMIRRITNQIDTYASQARSGALDLSLDLRIAALTNEINMASMAYELRQAQSSNTTYVYV